MWELAIGFRLWVLKQKSEIREAGAVGQYRGVVGCVTNQSVLRSGASQLVKENRLTVFRPGCF